MRLPLSVLLLLCTIASVPAYSQDSSKLDRAISFPAKLFSSLDKKTGQVEARLDKKSYQYLNKLERREKKLYRKMFRKDSVLAKQTFGNIDSTYDALKNTSIAGKSSNIYSGHLDTLSTALKFLGQGQSNASPEIQKSLQRYKDLQGKLNTSDQIKRQLQKRQQLMKDQFQKVGMVKDIKGLQKDLYYYNAQVKEYKKTFEDPSKVEQKLVDLVMKTGLFKDFFRKNSALRSMFAVPGPTTGSTASLAGLQTRASVSQMMVDRFGSSSTTTSMLRQNVQSAQSQLNQFNNKANSFSSGSYGNGSPDMPDFKTNSQKTKSFLQRIEVGTNIQSQRSRYYFPATTDLGISLGYRFTDKLISGIGPAYKLGLGNGWEHIQLTHQGIGLRSYLDFKLKKSFYISGGYERNYLSQFKSLDQLKDYSAWQASGLVGLSKKYNVGKKFKGETKLLWDFLSYRQVTRTQAILFRVGYNLK